MFLPLLWTALVGCTPEVAGAKCNSGARESFSGTVTTPSGSVSLQTSQCVSLGWSHTACDDGVPPEFCEYFFEPNTPAKAPLQLVFGDLVFQHSFGHLELSPPEVIAGTADIRVALDTVQQQRLGDGYQVSPVQPTTMLDGHPAYGLTVSCDHPDTDVICPFTWDWFFVDLDALEPGLYADFSAQYAAATEPGNAATPLPEEFGSYDEMIRTITLELE